MDKKILKSLSLGSMTPNWQMNLIFTSVYPKHTAKFLSDSISNPIWFPRWRDGWCIGWMWRKSFCSWTGTRNNHRLDQWVMGWQHSHQMRADMPKIADCCCPEKRGFRSAVRLVKIFKRRKMLEGPKCLSTVLRHPQRREDGGVFPRQGQQQLAQLPGDGGAAWGSCPKSSVQPCCQALALNGDVKRRPFWYFYFHFHYWVSNSCERERERFWS